ncbi:MAG TPA: hypothetical protein VKE71_08945 [Candidatus Angelobacter sp.]|nr:hypothetical protein [Candidatus Angelobacter sp.]
MYEAGTSGRATVSEQGVILLRAIHLVIRILLVLACAFWALIVLELLPPLVFNGMDGVRAKLVYIWTLGRAAPGWSCQDTLQLLHEGYTDLLIFLALTWMLAELKRFLYRRMVEISAMKPGQPEQEVPQLQ